MKYQFITIRGVKLGYQEKNGSSEKIIFFFHGNSGSHKIWSDLFGHSSFDAYRLIAFDLPAHGLSSSLEGTGIAYSFPDLGRLMRDAVKQLSGESPFVLAGLSIGTNIVVEMLDGGVSPAGIVLTGPCVLGDGLALDKIFKFDSDGIHAASLDTVTEDELRDYAKLGFSSEKENAFPEFRKDYYAVKDGFRPKLFASIGSGQYSDEIALLRNQQIPILVIFGANEKVCVPTYLDDTGINFWRKKPQIVADAEHLVNIDQPDELSSLIGDYSREVFK